MIIDDGSGVNFLLIDRHMAPAVFTTTFDEIINHPAVVNQDVSIYYFDGLDYLEWEYDMKCWTLVPNAGW